MNRLAWYGFALTLAAAQLVFSVQYHPEASPGPHDSHYLFRDFRKMMEAWKK